MKVTKMITSYNIPETFLGPGVMVLNNTDDDSILIKLTY